MKSTFFFPPLLAFEDKTLEKLIDRPLPLPRDLQMRFWLVSRAGTKTEICKGLNATRNKDLLSATSILDYVKKDRKYFKIHFVYIFSLIFFLHSVYAIFISCTFINRKCYFGLYFNAE